MDKATKTTITPLSALGTPRMETALRDAEARLGIGWVPCDGGCGFKAYRHRPGEKAYCDGCHANAWTKLTARDSA